MKKQVDQLVPSDANDSVLQEALRQWVEICMLHIEHKKSLTTPSSEGKKMKINQKGGANSRSNFEQ
jgi:hypothetical protein